MPVQPQTWLDAFLPATTRDGNQSDARAVQLKNGNIVVTWTSDSPNGAGSSSGLDVIGRIFDPAGQPVGEEFRINRAYFFHDESDAEIVSLNDGGFLAVYLDVDGSSSALRMDRFDANGSEVSSKSNFPSADDIDLKFTVASSAFGSAMVAYQEGNAVKAQLYDPETDTIGPEFTLAQSAGGPVSDPKLFATANGNYVLVAEYNSGGDTSIVHKVVNPLGDQIAPLSFVAGTQANARLDSDPDVTGLAGGGYATVWRSVNGADRELYVQRYTDDGIPIGSKVDVNAGIGGIFNPRDPHIAATSDGGFVVVFGSGSDGGIKARVFDADGNSVGAFTTITDDPTAQDLKVDATADGRIVVTWTDGVTSSNVSTAIIDPRDTASKGAGVAVGTVGDDTLDGRDGGKAYGGDGDDIFTFGPSGELASVVDGGEGFDTLQLKTSQFLWFDGSILKNIEAVEFHGNVGISSGFYFTSSQFGEGGLSESLEVDGNNKRNNAIEIVIDTNDTFDLSGFQFKDWHDAENIMLVFGSSSNDDVIGTSADDKIYLSDGNDKARGGRGNDEIHGQDGDDTLEGGSGNDTLRGGDDDDHLAGGAGEDSVRGDDGDDRASGGAGNDTVSGGDGRDALFGNNGEDILSGGNDNDTLNAGADNDFAAGGQGSDVINGGGGDDTMAGGTQNDIIKGNAGDDLGYGDEGEDQLLGHDGDDKLFGGSGADMLDGGKGDDEVRGEDGDDILRGGTGDDTVVGGRQDDSMNGGAGDDEMQGNHGADRVLGETGNDYLTGGTGNDTLLGGGNDDVLLGGAHDDLVRGEFGRDTLDGGSGNDTVRGDEGADVLDGGAGKDILIGGTGADRFVFSEAEESAPGSHDRITDFEDFRDIIDLSGIDANTELSGNQTFSFIGDAGFTGAGQLRVSTNGNTTTLTARVDSDGSTDLRIDLSNFSSTITEDLLIL